MGKGGPRNLRKPELCTEHLNDILDSHVRSHGLEHCFRFEPYGESLMRGSACNAAGLVKAKAFVCALAHAAPSLTVKYRELKDCLAALAMRWKGLVAKVSLHQQENWPGSTASKIMVLLAHVRRLHDPQKFKECCSKATEWQIQQLEILRDLALAAREEDQRPALKKTATKVGKPTEETPAKKRKASELGLDLDVPVTPSLQSCGEEWLGDEAEKASPIPSSKQKIKASLGLQSKKKPACKTAKKPAAAAGKTTSQGHGMKSGITEGERQALFLMPYKSSGACAIRVRNGRQLLQVKAETPKKSAEMAKKLLKKLEGKMTLQAALDLKAEWLNQ